ncbi:MAG: hypothetical protein ACI8VT_001073, partial [Saprospiraceae bacterium]
GNLIQAIGYLLVSLIRVLGRNKGKPIANG